MLLTCEKVDTFLLTENLVKKALPTSSLHPFVLLLFSVQGYFACLLKRNTETNATTPPVPINPPASSAPDIAV